MKEEKEEGKKERIGVGRLFGLGLKNSLTIFGLVNQLKLLSICINATINIVNTINTILSICTFITSHSKYKRRYSI